MKDEHIAIKSEDGVQLNCVLNRSKTDEVLVVFVHGLTGDWYKTIPHVLARECVKNDISIARLSLYPGGGGRNLLDTDISTHALDVDEWVRYFGKDYRKIVLVGHSLGCPAIYIGKSPGQVAGLVYLEPSIGTRKKEDMFEYLSELGVFSGTGGVRSLISKSLVNDWCNLNGQEVLDCNVSQLFVFGEKMFLKEDWAPVLINKPENAEQIVVQDAGHGFSENDTMDEMFEVVIGFIKKIS